MLLLLLLMMMMMLFGRCESLTDSSLPSIFFPFGTDERDSIVSVGDDNCEGPVDIPYQIFNNRRVYVSASCTIRSYV